MHDHLRRAERANATTIQRKEDGAVGVPGKRTLTEALPAAPSGGLPAPLRAKMESYFKTDFSAVRVREDDRARALGAIAYTQGNELVFQPGKYDPVSPAGQELIGHELAHVVQQRQGRAATAGGGAPVQRYRDATISEVPFHISDGGSMAVRASGEDPNKTFFARFAALQRAQAQLANAGSLFHLQAKEVVRGYAKIEPKFVGLGSEQGKVYDADQDKNGVALTTQGARTGMAADCNNAARMVMGILHQPDMTDATPDEEHIERPMLGRGRDSRQLALPDEEVVGAKGAHETAGLTALTEALKGYRAVVETRPINTTHRASVEAFLLQTAGMDKPVAKAWTVFGTLRNQHRELYADLTAWAGLDAAIMPEVGDALVAWRRQGDTTAVNRRAYTAMVDVLEANIRNLEQRGQMTAALQARITEQQLALTAAVQAVATEDAILVDQNQALRHAAAQFRRTEAEKKRVLIATNVEQLTAVHEALAGYTEESNARDLATRALAVLGVSADTTWQQTVDTMNKSYGTDEHEQTITIARKVLGTEAENALTGAMGDNDLWNKHWGGVVMTEPESGDYVTLENDASTKDDYGAVNAQWRFTMYGSKKGGQSFHAKNEASGDFGERASTVRFRAPNQEARELPDLTPAEQAEVERLEAERAEAERQRDLERKRQLEQQLRALYSRAGMGSCRQEVRGPEDRDGFGGGGPPALCKAEAGAHGAAIHADPALEAEADAHGAAAARHGEE